MNTSSIKKRKTEKWDSEHNWCELISGVPRAGFLQHRSRGRPQTPQPDPRTMVHLRPQAVRQEIPD